MKYSQQLEEFGYNFPVRERVVTTVVLSPPHKSTAERWCLWSGFFLPQRCRSLCSLPPSLNFGWPARRGRFSLHCSLDLRPFKRQKGGMVNGNCDVDSCPSRAGL